MAVEPGAPPVAAPAPAEAAPSAVHAMRHREQQVRTYPCRTCGGELVFSIGEQKLGCPHCGNLQELVEVSGAVEEQDLAAALRKNRTPQADVQELVAGEKEIVCHSCGGHTTFTGTWTAARCPYCATPVQRDDVHDAPSRLAVDGILPFAVDERAATEALQKWVSSRRFAPSEFKDYSRAGSFSSVYTAYFTYDAEATTTYRGERGDRYTVTVGEGQNKRTETRVRWSRRSGTVFNAFDDVLVLANEGLDAGHSAALAPWPLDQLQPFSHEFVAGHLSRTYDRDVEACLVDAKQQMESVIDTTVRRDIGGDEQRVHESSTTWGAMTFKHVLLPIWLLTVMYDGRAFQVMINGVTGQVRGERPYSKVKIAIAVVLALIVVAVLVVLLRRR